MGIFRFCPKIIMKNSENEMPIFYKHQERLMFLGKIIRMFHHFYFPDQDCFNGITNDYFTYAMYNIFVGLITVYSCKVKSIV